MEKNEIENMEKYSGLKTIGDGTYGSVVKAMNMKTGKTFPYHDFTILLVDFNFYIV